MYDVIIYSGFMGFVITTKYDKNKKGQIQQHINQIKKKLEIEDEGLIFAYSAETKHNKDVLEEQVEVIINA